MGFPHSVVLAALAVIVSTACAPAVVQEPAQLTPGGGKSFRLGRTVKVLLSTGYSTTLRVGTRWDLVGSLAQGDVYKTKDQVVTVEGSDIHEAYIVVNDDRLTGFYLPVKSAFSPVTSVQLSFE